MTPRGLDCAALSAAGDSGLALPASGTLLFSLFDGRLDGDDCMVHPEDPGTRPGARVLFVPAGTPTRRHPAPDELPPYLAVALTAQAGLNVPTSHAPGVRARSTHGPDDEAAAWVLLAVLLTGGGVRVRVHAGYAPEYVR
ncbi:hypothetical protein [Streptomyces virginiae]|uniref:hypothetical protein n=1 Tax=Streptomyces virginiae TaxID=1961 RepID=UPI002DB7F632|nr:hypothetical protein [Streptomyces sp. CMAA1738]MEC4575621.1 hypothetical protein [Streptomyces sp. CMAA1738]